jgi:release factor glutamine methyltransferase
LARRRVESPRLQVEWMLSHLLTLPRMQLYLNFERALSEENLAALRRMVVRRGNREPLQHILGSVSFCGCEIASGPQALIPRPETEILAESAWQWLNARAAEGSGALYALDFGAGTGCLSVVMALNAPSASITALEVSPQALALARKNAETHRVADRITFLESDGFAALPETALFDLVVSNPPYIPSAEIDQLEPEVRDHDPRLALDGGRDGLDFYRLLAVQARSRMRPGGRLMLEIGDGQGGAVRLALESQMWIVETVGPDYNGRQRFVTAAPRRD